MDLLFVEKLTILIKILYHHFVYSKLAQMTRSNLKMYGSVVVSPPAVASHGRGFECMIRRRPLG